MRSRSGKSGAVMLDEFDGIKAIGDVVVITAE